MEPTPTVVSTISLIASDKVQLLNVFFGVLGVIGTVLTIFEVAKSRKKDRTYKYLFDLADKNIDNDIADEELGKKKEDIKRATEKINLLQMQIRKEIPIEAKRAVLKDRLYAEIETLGQIYTSIHNLKKQLNEMSGNIKIPPDLMREVESEISPNYLKQQKESKLKTYLTILTTTVAILSTILDSSLERVVNIIFFILIIPILFQWLRLSRPWRENKVLIYLFQEPHRILLSSAVFLLLLSFLSIFLYENMDYSYKSYDFFAEIGLILLFFSLLLFIISGAVYFNYWLRNRKSPHNEKKKKDDPVKSEKASK